MMGRKKKIPFNIGVLSNGTMINIKKVRILITQYNELSEWEQVTFISSQEKFSHENNKKFFKEVNRIKAEIDKEKKSKK
jgi:hypothetical protein